ncbi:37S ribosomal protein S23, mitochondrial [Cytospora mali]|uniref:Small ribosomal subunit protein mS29 n=1 Tax=Cytospora mali TaxID=578113 RepID=A0A194V0Q1_CYTMA|nr:37S ribosomal protein S23, mitochondrial [Valsa mali var. pyri (nom. inval.)]
MSSQSCWRCLLRPSTTAASSTPRHMVPMATIIPTTTTATPSSSTAAFSTTAHPQAVGQHQRTGKRMTLSKFKKPKEILHGKTPLPGERKAWRKRIVLSNNNAVPVHGASRLDAANMVAPESAGRVFKIPEDTIDQLRASEAFKSSQTWGLFHSPHVLVRPETVHMCSRMKEETEKGQTLRMVVSGEKAAGKSLVLLQAMSNAFLNEWVVINIPEAQELTTACTEYAPIPDTNPQQWMQSVYALKLMQNIRSANRAVLDRVYTTRSYEDFTNPVAEGATLNALIESAREPDQAWGVFSALWHELTLKSEASPRPPVLFALDGLSFVMKMSDYRDPAFELIHSHDLAIVRMFVDLLSGKASFPNGGAVIAATCRSNSPRNASMELAIERQAARQAGVADEDLPPRDPYSRKYDTRTDEVMEGTGLEVLNVTGISKKEARSLMEYWAASGMLRATVDEKEVSEKWITGGNGIIGQMEKAGLLSLRL